MEENRLLRRDEAAAYIRSTYNIRCSKSTLASMATRGGGPAFRRIGNSVVYDTADLNAWVRRRTSPKVHSSAELGLVA